MLRKLKFILAPLGMVLGVNTYADVSCAVSGSVWNNGYVTNVAVTNAGESLQEGWSVALLFDDTPTINNSWSAELAVDGNVLTASNVAWNANLSAGQSAHFGFVGSYSGEFELPECFVGALDDDTALEDYLKQGVHNHLNLRIANSASGSSSSSSSSGASSSSSSSSASSASSTSSGAPVAEPDTQPDDITNTQEDGVDEADIIESDGNHFFVVRSSLYFTGTSSSTSGSSSSSASSSGSGGYGDYAQGVLIEAYSKDSAAGTTQHVGQVTLPYEENYLHVSGAYFRKTPQGNRLAIVSNTRESQPYYWSYGYGYYPYYQISNKVAISVANIDIPELMDESERITFDGDLVSSRRIGSKLYIASRYSPNLSRLGFDFSSSASNEENAQRLDDADLTDLLPHVYDENGVGTPLVTATDCTVPEWPEKVDVYAGSLLVITQIDLDNNLEISSRCLPASATEIYSSADAIYAFSNAFSVGVKVHKFTLKNDTQESEISYKGSVKLPGSIACSNQSYCFGEHDGALRVLYRASNYSDPTPYRIAVIKQSSGSEEGLEVIATLPNAERPASIGKPGEIVYAMRSFGDHAYVVTFDRIDPLYAINFSNPADPYIAGELEVTGVSDYLHPVGENLLLGVGRDAIFDEARNLTWFQGVKVELFDVSDPTNLRSLGSEVIGKRGSSTTLSFDTRGIAFSHDENGIRFAIPVKMHDKPIGPANTDALNQYYSWTHTGLYVYQIETQPNTDASLSRLGILKTDIGEANVRYDRGVIDGDAVYYLHNYHMFSSLINYLAQ